MHVAIITDGNGRWATARGLPRAAGHQAGAQNARRLIEVAPRLGITTLTFYGFSSDNWQRPPREVAALMRLFREYLLKETATCVENGVTVDVIGRRDRLPRALVRLIEHAERATAGGRNLHLRVALDYSARDAIVRAAALAAQRGCTELSRAEFVCLLGAVDHAGTPALDVDLLIRTGGEQRLSDFLLFECAYAELFFSPKLFPDFDEAELAAAVEAFARRERRFGALPGLVAGG